MRHQPFAKLLFVFSLLGVSCVNAAQTQSSYHEPPRLILQITVDQLRGDLLGTCYERYGEGGVRYLFEKGVVYDNAHYEHSNTETIVGHAVLATGAQPSVHGMVANVWLNRETNELRYNIEDPDYELLSKDAGVDKKSELDPTQKVAKVTGRSPAAILTSTFSDELAVRFGKESKIFGVSVKDRGAVSLAGHAGKAFWFSKSNGEFVTSNYYYEQYPNWVNKWNGEQPSNRYAGTSWELLLGADTYTRDDNRPYETDLAGFGRVFPHPYGKTDSKYYYTLLTLSPAGDELTIDFAKALVEAEGLGADSTPDYLSVSLSSTDYVGHMFGPGSRETEDNLLRLDRALADLFAFIDKKVGLENTLIVLSADHGAPEAPEYMAGLGMEVARIMPDSDAAKPFVERVQKQFGIEGELLEVYYHPYIYLNREAIKAAGADQAEVERALAAEIMKTQGIAAAVSSTDLQRGNVPETALIKQIRNNFHPKRSGDVYLVQEPYWFLYPESSVQLCTIHGSPWTYDTYVPIIFAGKGINPKRVHRLVHPVDIAATLSVYVGAKPPSGSVGTPLVEVVGQ